MSIASCRDIFSASFGFSQPIIAPQELIEFHQNSLENSDFATPLSHLIRSFQIDGTLPETRKKIVLQVFNDAVQRTISHEDLKETALNTASSLIDSLLQIGRGTILVNPPVLYPNNNQSFENVSKEIAKRCKSQLENDDLGELFHLCFDTIRRTAIPPKHQFQAQLNLAQRSIQIGLPNAPGVREDAMKIAPHIFKAFHRFENEYRSRLETIISDQQNLASNDCAIL